jgi:hypothetical protein
MVCVVGLDAWAEDDLQRADTGAVLNVIHSERLRFIMQQLDILSYDRERTALELQKLQLRQVEALLEAANELLLRSEQLPQIVPDSSLTEGERITFRALAAELYQQTLYINAQYRMGQGANVQLGYRQLHQTCAACHRLFRAD